MITFYGYRKCATCRKAEKALVKAGRAYDFVDVTGKPPSIPELRRIQAQAGLPARKLFNTSGEQYKALGLKDRVDGMSDAAIHGLLAGNGRLIKRPLVTDGAKSTVGFDETAFAAAWGGTPGKPN